MNDVNAYAILPVIRSGLEKKPDKVSDSVNSIVNLLNEFGLKKDEGYQILERIGYIEANLTYDQAEILRKKDYVYSIVEKSDLDEESRIEPILYEVE
jgi:hypothetical protein